MPDYVTHGDGVWRVIPRSWARASLSLRTPWRTERCASSTPSMTEADTDDVGRVLPTSPIRKDGELGAVHGRLTRLRPRAHGAPTSAAFACGSGYTRPSGGSLCQCSTAKQSTGALHLSGHCQQAAARRAAALVPRVARSLNSRLNVYSSTGARPRNRRPRPSRSQGADRRPPLPRAKELSGRDRPAMPTLRKRPSLGAFSLISRRSISPTIIHAQQNVPASGLPRAFWPERNSCQPISNGGAGIHRAIPPSLADLLMEDHTSATRRCSCNIAGQPIAVRPPKRVANAGAAITATRPALRREALYGSSSSEPTT